MKNSIADPLLTVQDVAGMLKIKPSTVYAWSYERKIPSIKLGGRLLRFRLSEIEKRIRQDERRALQDTHE